MGIDSRKVKQADLLSRQHLPIFLVVFSDGDLVVAPEIGNLYSSCVLAIDL